MSRNPIARDLRSPKYRERVVPDAKLMADLDRFRARQDALLKALDDDDDAWRKASADAREWRRRATNIWNDQTRRWEQRT